MLASYQSSKHTIVHFCVLLVNAQVLANFLSAPLASGSDGDARGWPYVAFDVDPAVVKVRF